MVLLMLLLLLTTAPIIHDLIVSILVHIPLSIRSTLLLTLRHLILATYELTVLFGVSLSNTKPIIHLLINSAWIGSKLISSTEGFVLQLLCQLFILVLVQELVEYHLIIVIKDILFWNRLVHLARPIKRLSDLCVLRLVLWSRTLMGRHTWVWL